MNKSKYLFLALTAMSLASAPPATALSPPPPQPDDFLLPALYEALDGDNWINNDGWLDPDVHWCDWYGVRCFDDGDGLVELLSLDLSSNGLSGQFNAATFESFSTGQGLPTLLFDLSNNSISGALDALPASSQVVRLENNLFAGNLPELLPIDSELSSDSLPIRFLDLSDNDFSGAIPESWPNHLRLQFLNLSNNQLDEGIERAIATVHSANPPALSTRNSGLWLADNLFSGELNPEWFEGRELVSINLCWNAIEIADPELANWIAERHWGGSPDQCLGRERLAPDPTISGSWFNPQRSGEGLSLMLLDNGTPLVYWFSHISRNRQFWLFNSGQAGGSSIIFDRLLRTRGEFGEGFAEAEFPLFRGGALRLDRVDESAVHAEFSIGYTGYDLIQPGEISITWPPLPDVGFRSDHVQLSRLAGSTCDNQLDHQWISGAWFNPERSGEGFVVEVVEDGRGVVYWFTYTPDDTNEGLAFAPAGDWQAWMTGDARFDGSTLTIDPLYQPKDSGAEMPASTEFIELNPIGHLEMRFLSDLSGEIEFISDSAQFQTSSYPIERLARPMLAECD